MFPIPTRTAARAAYLTTGLSVAAGIAMATLLRPGLPAVGSILRDRMAYVTIHTEAWWPGWILWHLAALSMVGFYFGLASRWGRDAPLRCTLALVCAVAGFAADMVGEGAYMGIVPHQAEQGFFFTEQAAGLITGYSANGLYTVAGLLLTWAGSRELPRILILLSAIPWAAGFWLCGASLESSLRGQMMSAALLMPSFAVWTALVGRWLASRPS